MNKIKSRVILMIIGCMLICSHLSIEAFAENPDERVGNDHDYRKVIENFDEVEDVGTYIIYATANGSDKEQVEMPVYVTVTNPYTVIQTKYREAIDANNFKYDADINIKALSRDELIYMSGASAWNLNDGSDVEITSVEVTDVYKEQYEVTFSTAKGTKVKINARIADENVFDGTDYSYSYFDIDSEGTWETKFTLWFTLSFILLSFAPIIMIFIIYILLEQSNRILKLLMKQLESVLVAVLIISMVLTTEMEAQAVEQSEETFKSRETSELTIDIKYVHYNIENGTMTREELIQLLNIEETDLKESDFEYINDSIENGITGRKEVEITTETGALTVIRLYIFKCVGSAREIVVDLDTYNELQYTDELSDYIINKSEVKIKEISGRNERDLTVYVDPQEDVSHTQVSSLVIKTLGGGGEQIGPLSPENNSEQRTWIRSGDDTNLIYWVVGELVILGIIALTVLIKGNRIMKETKKE
ncbi:MAG: hypothetical protein ACK5LL_07285 [Suipraeoptans sp.]